MKARLIAIGQDPYWLAALGRAMSGTGIELSAIHCEDELLACMPRELPEADTEALVLLDASGQGRIEDGVRLLRDLGWRYVVVAAADPSAKEATAILRGSLGYDYWEKSYDEPAVRARIVKCLEEMEAERTTRRKS